MITIQDLQKRHSVRSFTDKPLTDSQLKGLNAVITDVNTHEAGVKFQLITNDPEPFRGFSRGYGMFKGVRNYVACVVDTTYKWWLERAGYCGMQVMMKACQLGLGTCFVGGTYSAAHVAARIRVGEKMPFIIALGDPAQKEQTGISGLLMKFMHRKKVSAEDFLVSKIPLSEIDQAVPGFAEGLEAVSLAPSSLNKRPVRIHVRREAGEMVVEASVPAGSEADLGIAMYSFQCVCPGAWDWGNPARFYNS